MLLPGPHRLRGRLLPTKSRPKTTSVLVLSSSVITVMMTGDSGAACGRPWFIQTSSEQTVPKRAFMQLPIPIDAIEQGLKSYSRIRRMFEEHPWVPWAAACLLAYPVPTRTVCHRLETDLPEAQRLKLRMSTVQIHPTRRTFQHMKRPVAYLSARTKPHSLCNSLCR